MLKKLAKAKGARGGGGSSWNAGITAHGEEDAYEDGTSALRDDDALGGGEGGATWRVEGEDAGLGVAPVRSRLRMERAMDFGEEEARYRGKKGSRQALLEAEDTSEDEDEDEEEKEVSEEDEASDEDVESSSASGSDSEEEDEDEEPTLEEEMEQLRQDKKGMALLLKRSRDEQRQRAEQARQHRDMWNKLLEVRILLQRLLGMANRFPREEARAQYCQAAEETEAGFQGVATGLRGVLANLVGMRNEQAAAVADEEEEEEEAARRRKKQRVMTEAFVAGKTAVGSAQDPWVACQADYGTCREHWKEALDAAHQRATLSLAVSKTFRVVNQGLWHQIEAASTRAVKRTHLTRAQVKAAGLFSGGMDVDRKEKEAEEEEDDEEVDLEAFDDSELYQQLLRDYIQAVGPGGGGAGGMDAAAMAAMMGRSMSKKSKKKVDTKASKGRKLRYAVHPKLEHFMFPVPLPFCSMDINRLYASLPGRRRTEAAAAAAAAGAAAVAGGEPMAE